MGIDREGIQAVIFDIDGTLSDSDDLMVERVADHLRVVFPANPERRLSAARWLVMRAETPFNLLNMLMDRLDLDARMQAGMDKRRRKQEAKRAPEFRLIPGALELLDALRPHYKLAVATARDERTTLGFIGHFELGGYFELIVSAQTTRRTKPHPEPLLHAAGQMGVPPENCLMVGDTTVDMRAAKRAGMQAVAFLAGFGTEGELRRAGADLVLASPADLIPYLINTKN